MLWVAISIATRVAFTELHQCAEDVIGGLRIEISGRLVRQQRPRRVRHRARDRDPLLLAAGQFRRSVRDAITQAEIGEDLLPSA